MRQLAVVVAIVVSVATTAHAQPRRTASVRGPLNPLTSRFVVVLNGGVLFAVETLHQSFSMPINAEDGVTDAGLSRGVAGFIEGGVRVQATGRLRVGVIGFFGSGRSTGTIEAEIPHPFYFNQFRSVSGVVSGLMHREAGAHVELAYSLWSRANQTVVIFGGPSFIRLEQDLVTRVDYSDVYPYDSATFESAATTMASGSGVGLNIGAEMEHRLGRATFLAVTARYARAGVTLSPGGGNAVDTTAGGVQAGLGLRLLF